MELQCDMGQVEAHFCPFGDIVNLDARDEHAIGSEIILGTNDGTPW
jgi:hypothetical protein